MHFLLAFAPFAFADLGNMADSAAVMRELRSFAVALDANSVPCDNLDQLSRRAFDRPIPPECRSLAAQIGSFRQAERDFRAGCREHFALQSQYIKTPNLCGPLDAEIRTEYFRKVKEERRKISDAFHEFDLHPGPISESRLPSCDLAFSILLNARKFEEGLFQKNIGTGYAYFEEACTNPFGAADFFEFLRSGKRRLGARAFTGF